MYMYIYIYSCCLPINLLLQFDIIAVYFRFLFHITTKSTLLICCVAFDLLLGCCRCCFFCSRYCCYFPPPPYMHTNTHTSIDNSVATLTLSLSCALLLLLRCGCCCCLCPRDSLQRIMANFRTFGIHFISSLNSPQNRDIYVLHTHSLFCDFNLIFTLQLFYILHCTLCFLAFAFCFPWTF